jgi:hypothetical protein
LLAGARKGETQVIATYGPAKSPAQFRNFIDAQVIARWKHQPGNGTLYSNGKTINRPAKTPGSSSAAR